MKSCIKREGDTVRNQSNLGRGFSGSEGPASTRDSYAQSLVCDSSHYRRIHLVLPLYRVSS
jgi:hypothetical protein